MDVQRGQDVLDHLYRTIRNLTQRCELETKDGLPVDVPSAALSLRAMHSYACEFADLASADARFATDAAKLRDAIAALLLDPKAVKRGRATVDAVTLKEALTRIDSASDELYAATDDASLVPDTP